MALPLAPRSEVRGSERSRVFRDVAVPFCSVTRPAEVAAVGKRSGRALPCSPSLLRDVAARSRTCGSLPISERIRCPAPRSRTSRPSHPEGPQTAAGNQRGASPIGVGTGPEERGGLMMAKSTVQDVADVAKGAGTLVKGAATAVMGAAKGAKGVAMAVGKTPLAAAAATALGVAAVREHSKSNSTGTQSSKTAKSSSGGAKKTTAKSSSGGAKKTTAKSSSGGAKKTTAKSSSGGAKKTTAKSSSGGAKKTTAKRSSGGAKKTTAKRSSGGAKKTTAKRGSGGARDDGEAQLGVPDDGEAQLRRCQEDDREARLRRCQEDDGEAQLRRCQEDDGEAQLRRCQEDDGEAQLRRCQEDDREAHLTSRQRPRLPDRPPGDAGRRCGRAVPFERAPIRRFPHGRRSAKRCEPDRPTGREEPCAHRDRPH